jgi:hypothetical protein
MWLVVLAGCGRLGFGEVPPPTDWLGIGDSAIGEGISGIEVGQVRLALAPSGDPVVAWTASPNGDDDVFLRAWDGSAWREIGGSASTGISADAGPTLSGGLVVRADGSPCIAYRNDDSVTLYVRCFDGSAWVGLEDPTGKIDGAGNPWWPKLALDDDHPVLAWEDYVPDPSGILVRRFDAGWSELAGSGTGSGISATTGDAHDASIDAANGEIAIGWTSSTDEDIHAAVWTGGTWRALGNVSATPTSSERQSIKLGAMPYVAWMEHQAAGPSIHLRAYDGTSWVELAGSATGTGLSGAHVPAFYPALAVGAAGEPIVAYQHANDIYVKHWTGTTWELLGKQLDPGGISATGVADWPEIAAANGQVHVAWANGDYAYLKALR